MSEHQENTRPVNPRRRRRSKMQIFKETYLPFLIVAVSFVLVVIFMIGGISRIVEKRAAQKQADIEASEAAVLAQQQMDQEATLLTEQAKLMAAGYDYAGAITLLDSFSGDKTAYPQLTALQQEYTEASASLVSWNDPGKIVNLSFQLLMADPARAFRDQTYSTSYNRNFVSVNEFSAILQQLYDNGYVLVGLKDCVTQGVTEDGTPTFVANEILLPEGKTPFMLTQVQVNYYTYMVDGNGDKIADKDGAGFASKLMLDESGKLTCEFVDSTGQTVYGDYDLIPILEGFIEAHPDFSYRNARATIALTAYDGILGYRTTPSAEQYFGTRIYEQDVADATAVVQELRKRGYHIACYTYENLPYGATSVADIEKDLAAWKSETAQILGAVDTLVFARDSDIASAGEAYSGDRYAKLKDAGFTLYLGFCTEGTPWAVCTPEYFRQGRLTVSGSTMAHHADWFTGIFDPSVILDPSRGNVPQ